MNCWLTRICNCFPDLYSRAGSFNFRAWPIDFMFRFLKCFPLKPCPCIQTAPAFAILLLKLCACTQIYCCLHVFINLNSFHLYLSIQFEGSKSLLEVLDFGGDWVMKVTLFLLQHSDWRPVCYVATYIKYAGIVVKSKGTGICNNCLFIPKFVTKAREVYNKAVEWLKSNHLYWTFWEVKQMCHNEASLISLFNKTPGILLISGFDRVIALKNLRAEQKSKSKCFISVCKQYKNTVISWSAHTAKFPVNYLIQKKEVHQHYLLHNSFHPIMHKQW